MPVTAMPLERRETTLVLRGSISRADLSRLADALDAAEDMSPTTVLVDLSGLMSWSLVAQAMLLSTARTIGQRGGELVLINPTPASRLQGARLAIFRRITTIYTNGGPIVGGVAEPDVALLAVRHRRALFLRSHTAPALRLPGGALDNGDDPRHTLARLLRSQLGIAYDERALHPFPDVESFLVNENGRRVRTACFQAPLHNGLAATNGRELVWASSQTSGLFTPSAHHAIAALHEADHID